MAKKGFGTGVCVYCGGSDAPPIGEHIFGREFFLVRHRTRLPKVPGCQKCNTIKSQLENRLMVTVPLAANHPAAKEYAELNLPRRFKGNRKLHKDISKSLARNENGKLVYAADATDILEWLLMVTKGLFAYHFHRPLHKNWEPHVRHVTAAQEVEGDAVMKALVGLNPEIIHRNIGEGTIEYWGQRSQRLPYCSAWQFNVFGGLEWTGDPEAPDETYTKIHCCTLRSKNAPSTMEAGERDW